MNNRQRNMLQLVATTTEKIGCLPRQYLSLNPSDRCVLTHLAKNELIEAQQRTFLRKQETVYILTDEGQALLSETTLESSEKLLDNHKKLQVAISCDDYDNAIRYAMKELTFIRKGYPLDGLCDWTIPVNWIKQAQLTSILQRINRTL